MDNTTTAMLVYVIAHLWWITYRIGRIEGILKRNGVFKNA